MHRCSHVPSAVASAALLIGTAACGPKLLRADVTQPNPLRQPLETLRVSEPAVIVTGDMELEAPRETYGSGPQPMVLDRYPLRNSARFTVISRDRIRFHVQLEHKWQEYTDIGSWRAVLIDEVGAEHVPVAIEPREGQQITQMWDQERLPARRDRYGDIVDIDDSRRGSEPLGSMTLFRGGGDIVFYGKDLFTPETDQVTLHLIRGDTTYEFTWRFAEAGDEPTVAARELSEDD